jgi:hypothetical protein
MTARSPQPPRRWIGGALLALSVLSFVETLRINDGWAGARLLPLVVIELLVGFAPGGGADNAARLIASA